MAAEGDQHFVARPLQRLVEEKRIFYHCLGQPSQISHIVHTLHIYHPWRKRDNIYKIITNIRSRYNEGLFCKCPALYGA